METLTTRPTMPDRMFDPNEMDWKGRCTRCGSLPIVQRRYDKYERLCERCKDEE